MLPILKNAFSCVCFLCYVDNLCSLQISFLGQLDGLAPQPWWSEFDLWNPPGSERKERAPQSSPWTSSSAHITHRYTCEYRAATISWGCPDGSVGKSPCCARVSTWAQNLHLYKQSRVGPHASHHGNAVSRGGGPRPLPAWFQWVRDCLGTTVAKLLACSFRTLFPTLSLHQLPAVPCVAEVTSAWLLLFSLIMLVRLKCGASAIPRTQSCPSSSYSLPSFLSIELLMISEGNHTANPAPLSSQELLKPTWVTRHINPGRTCLPTGGISVSQSKAEFLSSPNKDHSRTGCDNTSLQSQHAKGQGKQISESLFYKTSSRPARLHSETQFQNGKKKAHKITIFLMTLWFEVFVCYYIGNSQLYQPKENSSFSSENPSFLQIPDCKICWTHHKHTIP